MSLLRSQKLLGVLCCCIICLAGCSSPSHVSDEPIVATVSGVIEKEKDGMFVSDLFLNDIRGDRLFLLEGDTGYLEKFEGKEWVLKGTVSFSDSDIPVLKVFDSFLIDDSWEEYFIFENKFSFLLPQGFYLENKNDKILVFDSSGDLFFSVYKITEEISVDENEVLLSPRVDSISVGEEQWYRFIKSSHIAFYNPVLQLQFDFTEDISELSLFYSILDSVKNQDIVISSDSSLPSPDSPDFLLDNKNEEIIVSPALALSAIESFLQTLPESKSVRKIEIWDNFLLFEIYNASQRIEGRKVLAQPKRTLFQLDNSGVLQEVAQWHWEDDNWIQGGENNTIWKNTNRFFPSHLLQEYGKKQQKGFVTYFSSQYHFSISYPRQMYYNEVDEESGWQLILRDTPKSSVTTEEVEKSADEENEVVILSLAFGEVDKRKDLIEENLILIPKSETAHFRFYTPRSDSFSLLQEIANTLVLY